MFLFPFMCWSCFWSHAGMPGWLGTALHCASTCPSSYGRGLVMELNPAEVLPTSLTCQ